MIKLSDVKVGLKVQCPARKPKGGYSGEIVWVGTPAADKSFCWVSVRDAKGQEHAWPSNRIELEKP